MGLFKVFKGSNKKDTPEEKINKKNVKTRHNNRISNLKNEYEVLSRKLKDVELDVDMAKSEKDKSSDRLIRRMTLLRYEINIREELVRWL